MRMAIASLLQAGLTSEEVTKVVNGLPVETTRCGCSARRDLS